MHSYVIALNAHPAEDAILERLPKDTDYVIDYTHRPNWSCGACEQMRIIGTVDKDRNVALDPELVKNALEALYERYLKCAIKSFDDFADYHKQYAAIAALNDECSIYIYYGDWDECMTWADFLRRAHKGEISEDLTIEAVYDYHF